VANAHLACVSHQVFMVVLLLLLQVWTWLHGSCPSREHRTIDSVPGEAAQHRPWEISQGE
jgi:hypothetical protein